MNYLPGLVSNHNPPHLASWVVRIRGVSHQCLATERFYVIPRNAISSFSGVRPIDNKVHSEEQMSKTKPRKP
jgi:hypothetical protein